MNNSVGRFTYGTKRNGGYHRANIVLRAALRTVTVYFVKELQKQIIHSLATIPPLHYRFLLEAAALELHYYLFIVLSWTQKICGHLVVIFINGE